MTTGPAGDHPGDGGEAADGSEAGDELESQKRGWSRATICVSSQVGCAVDCRFCLTALLGVKRNLTAGEIIGQVVTNGPVIDPPDPSLRGLTFYRTGSLEEARRLAEADPAVQAGRLAADIMIWYCPPGTMREPGRAVTV